MLPSKQKGLILGRKGSWGLLWNLVQRCFQSHWVFLSHSQDLSAQRGTKDGCEQTDAPQFRCSGCLMAVTWAQVSPSHTTPGGQGCFISRELWPGNQMVDFLLLLGLFPSWGWCWFLCFFFLNPFCFLVSEMSGGVGSFSIFLPGNSQAAPEIFLNE